MGLSGAEKDRLYREMQRYEQLGDDRQPGTSPGAMQRDLRQGQHELRISREAPTKDARMLLKQKIMDEARKREERRK